MLSELSMQITYLKKLFNLSCLNPVLVLHNFYSPERNERFASLVSQLLTLKTLPQTCELQEIQLGTESFQLSVPLQQIVFVIGADPTNQVMTNNFSEQVREKSVQFIIR